MKTPILAFLCALATAFLASGQVPSLINYQGRLTDANGAAVTGNKNFAINIFDAATGGNLLYSETIGAVTLDSNGVYSFQFGSAGTSNKQVTETIGTTAGTTLVYSKALANSSVVNNSITVTDGTNSWSQSVGNPGVGATATANTIVGFVIGATITNGGSGYTSAPEVTISGNGTGATATATLTDGVVTGITIVSAGSGYTTGATITIAPPVIPFRVEYASGTITATYASAPTAGRAIVATYRYGTGGIADALGNAGEHWMAITVDGVSQGTRQRVLAVPFATIAKTAESASGSLSKQIAELSRDLALLSGGISSDSTFAQNFAINKSSVITGETTLMDKDSKYSPISEQSASVAYTGGSTFLSQQIANLPVRGVLYRYGKSGYVESGNITFHYSDNTSSVSSVQISLGNQYLPNPNPGKLVKQIDFVHFGSYSYGLWITTRINNSGTIVFGIPSDLVPKSRIGLYLNFTSASSYDQFSAQMVGSAGIQPLNLNGYSVIDEAIGSPQKIVVSVTPSNENLEQYSKISGYVIRFSE